MREMKRSTIELGPIRPPSEAASLLIRLSRNCPWNKCAFCPVYKTDKFERRNPEDVIDEIDLMAEAVSKVRSLAGIDSSKESLTAEACLGVIHNPSISELERRIALWLQRGGEHVFLQDADSLIVPAHRVVPILKHLYEKFPSIKRVTTYARSRTLSAKTLDQLKSLKEAGLTRIHVGVESGAKEVLDLMQKGCKPAHHIEGCKKAIDAGFEVCCYVMPGLGGKQYSTVHASETGAVLREIEPHHIRLRSLYVMPGSPLGGMLESGKFELAEEDQMVLEVKTMLEALKGASSRIVSDHDFNLLMEIEGHVTEDADDLMAACNEFLDLPRETRDAFVVARRSGYFRTLSHFLSDPDHVHSFMPAVEKFKELGDGSLAMGMAIGMGIRSI